jgi:hypothetical protein
MAGENFDFLEGFGIAESSVKQPEKAYQTFLIKVCNQLAKDLSDYTKKNANNTGGLAASIQPFPTGDLTIEIRADDYFAYQDQGVNSVNSNNYGSQFSFNYPGVSANMAKAISQWKGMDMSHAYAVAYNIKQHGIKPKEILDNVITDKVLEKIAKDLSAVTGIIFSIKFDKATKQI